MILTSTMLPLSTSLSVILPPRVSIALVTWSFYIVDVPSCLRRIAQNPLSDQNIMLSRSKGLGIYIGYQLVVPLKNGIMFSTQGEKIVYVTVCLSIRLSLRLWRDGLT